MRSLLSLLISPMALALFQGGHAADHDVDIKRAIQLWEKMGLARCEEDSVPVVVQTGYYDGDTGQAITAIGFLRQNSGSAVFLVGCEHYSAADLLARPAAGDWTTKTSKLSAGTLWIAPGFCEDPNFCAAIMCAGTRHGDFSEQLFAQCWVENPHDKFISDWLGKPRDASIEAEAACQIARHLANALVNPTSDRSLTLKALKELDEAGLIVTGNTGRNLGTLIGEIEETLKPSLAEPESIDSVIEGLLESTTVLRVDSHDKSESAVIALGLKAVPSLAEHLKDRRLTRTCHTAPHCSSILSLGDACTQILSRLSNGRLRNALTYVQVMKWYREQQSPPP